MELNWDSWSVFRTRGQDFADICSLVTVHGSLPGCLAEGAGRRWRVGTLACFWPLPDPVDSKREGALPSGANRTVFVKDFVRFCSHALESIALSNLLLLAKSRSFFSFFFFHLFLLVVG